MPTEHISDKLLQIATQYAARASAKSSVEPGSPALSFFALFASLRTLGSRARRLGQLELGLAEFSSWQRPAMTLSWLLVWTVICFRPYLVIAIPILYLLTGYFVPGYAKKYSPEISQLEGEYGNLSADPVLESELAASKEEEDRNLFEVLRRGQAALEKIVALLDKFDNFRDHIAVFRDPQQSCLLFLCLIGVLITSLMVASHVSVSLLFASSAWIIVCGNHPQVKRLQKKLAEIELEILGESHILEHLIQWASHAKHNFVVDDEPFIRQVEVFELQQQGLTPRLWDTMVFTPFVYSSSSRFRATNQLPPGTANLDDVLAPFTWFFKDTESWSVDKDAATWVRDRELIDLNADGEWAYDGMWRRRRWTRLCYHEP